MEDESTRDLKPFVPSREIVKLSPLEDVPTIAPEPTAQAKRPPMDVQLFRGRVSLLWAELPLNCLVLCPFPEADEDCDEEGIKPGMESIPLIAMLSLAVNAPDCNDLRRR
mmetsp:Transcript_59725/g.121795  ORF Transcript_59725/g.121795 Transcript_59725/m.121795 type:complete len:110 (+) Transcript_59725:1097-1426(+)